MFGDSIVHGFVDSEGGWANRIRKYYDRETIDNDDFSLPTIFNLGIPGETTAGLLKRLEHEIIARLSTGEEYIFVFATGTNDCLYRDSGNESEPDKYRQALSEISEIAGTYTDRLLFVSLFPVQDELLQPAPWSTSGRHHSTERMSLFNDSLVRFCAESNKPCVDLWNVFAYVPELGSVLFDGLHPNDVGHELIAETVRPELEKLL